MWKRGPFSEVLQPGKRGWRSYCGSGSSLNGFDALAILAAEVGGQAVEAMVDSGCTQSLVISTVAQAHGRGGLILTLDGGEVQSRGEAVLDVMVRGVSTRVRFRVVDKLVGGLHAVLGMDFIMLMGGAFICGKDVQFGVERSPRMEVGASAVSLKPGSLSILDPDFLAEFDGSVWTVGWRWKEGRPPDLKNEIGSYESTKTEGAREKFDNEVERWIEEGWLRPCSEVDGGGVLPLMAVVQVNKDKVRPVLDFRELNEHVSNHPGTDAAVCSETLRRWRRIPGRLKIVDLKSAYLQVHVTEGLWQYQQVLYKGQRYFLTRLGFGLNSAPKIMTKIVQLVLAQDERVHAGTDSYIDDIIVDEDVILVEEVVEHLRRYGLETKPPEDLEGSRVLGLSISRSLEGELVFGRGNAVPLVDGEERLTRRKLFSICGQLIGHYPVCGWLRVACSYVKRESTGERWDDWVGDRAQGMIQEVLRRVLEEDPVKGYFRVADGIAGTVWCDASSIALGVVLEMGGRIVEDMAWLRKASDSSHINVAELDAVVKGVNLAVKWGLKDLKVMTDSATVLSWLNSVIVDDRRVKVAGMAEMLVRRRLSVVQEMMEEYSLTIVAEYVQSHRNKADELTRVNKGWLRRIEPEVCGISIADLHAQHHFGVDRSLHLARLVSPTVSREEVERCVRACSQCWTIDPAPVKYNHGRLEVERNWSRLALDVTHLGMQSYLTVVDCGPSRFAIWRRIRSENAAEIGDHMEEIFRERGPPDELLMDNSTSFRSRRIEVLCDEWRIRRRYRAAYRPAGNGIVECHHRTIKARAVRAGADPLQIVFWYNLAAKEGVKDDSAPCASIFKYGWRHPHTQPCEEEGVTSEFCVGDRVWVKPPSGLCTARWVQGRVTGVTSSSNVSVDGVPRHVSDLRRVLEGENANEQPVAPVANGGVHERVIDVARLLEEACDEGCVVANERESEQLGSLGLNTLFDSESHDDGLPVREAPEVSGRPARNARAPAYLNDYEW